MSVERATMSFAGLMVLLSLALAYWVNPWWFALTVFVGANLLQSGFTGFCPVSRLIHKFGVKSESEIALKQVKV